MIVTGIWKTSELPGVPAELMDLAEYQPLLQDIGLVSSTVDAVLDPLFAWPHGTPKRQLEAISRRAEARTKALADELANAEKDRAAARLAAEQAAKAAAEESATFAASAGAPDVRGVRPPLASQRIWASEVRCLKSGHPLLIWTLTDPARLNGGAGSGMPGAENFDNVRRHVDNWLSAAGSDLVKAGVYRPQGFGNRRAFACPECRSVIKGRWVAQLPPEKWSVIAEGGLAGTRASEVLYRKQSPPLPAPTGTAAVKPPAAGLPAYVGDGDQRFIGPQRKPYWMAEARNDQEIAERRAAKEAHSARMQAIRDNPRYRASPNGFRFVCTDCGQIFEDDKESIHADARCLIPGARQFSW